MRSRVLEDDDVLECDQGDSFLTVNVIPSLQGGKGGEWVSREVIVKLCWWGKGVGEVGSECRAVWVGGGGRVMWE